MSLFPQAPTSQPAARPGALNALLAILIAIAVSLTLSACFWLKGAPGILNADGLLPVAFAHELKVHVATIGQFQLPRIPSLFPDLTVYLVLDRLLPDYRLALFGSSVFQVAAFLISAMLVISRATQRPMMVCALALCFATGLAFALNEAIGGPQYYHRMFAIFEHFGPVCMSMASLFIVLGLASRESRTQWIVLCGFETLALASNKGYAIIFLGPCVAALALEYWRDRLSRAFVLRFVACALAAAVLSMLALRILTLQPTPKVDHDLTHLSKFATDMVGLFIQEPAHAVLLLGPLLHLALLGRIRPLLLKAQPVRLVWTVACLATIGAFALTGLLYGDFGSLRYLTAAVYWPLVFIALDLALWASMSRYRSFMLGAVTALCFGGLGFSAVPAARAFHGWRSPLADCLLENKEAFGLRDGLAYYLLAGPPHRNQLRLAVADRADDGRPFLSLGQQPLLADPLAVRRGEAAPLQLHRAG
jgi:hypothetical protein